MCLRVCSTNSRMKCSTLSVHPSAVDIMPAVNSGCHTGRKLLPASDRGRRLTFLLLSFPCVAACAVDSQGQEACRDEGGNKEITSRDSSPPAPLPLPQYMPVDMKPIILMGSGSIHLNTVLYITTMAPRATCHRLPSFLAAGLEQIPRENI